MYKFKLPKTIISTNAKTGPIPAFMSAQSTCPDTCKLKGNGCYAENFPMSLAWKRVQDEGEEFSKIALKIRASGAAKFRAFTAGDMPHSRGKIDKAFAAELIALAKSVPMICYTHHRVDDTKTGEHNRAVIKSARRFGAAINSSADDWQDVDKRMAQGLPVVTVLPEGTTESVKTAAGNTIRVCPARLPDSAVTCANCKLCQNPDRTYAIGFPVHGARRRVINIKEVA